MTVIKALRTLFLFFLVSCSIEEPVNEYYLTNIEAWITVKESSGDPISGALVSCEIEGTTYGYYTNYQGVAEISYPILNQPQPNAEFPGMAYLTITHPDYQTETYDHPIEYEVLDNYSSGNVTTFIYRGFFMQSIWMDLN